MTMPRITQLAPELKMTGDAVFAKSTLRSWCRDSWQGCAAEFLSTTILVLLGCMACIPVEGFNVNINMPFGYGFIVMSNIQVFGHISGAYMNPAVTTAAVIWGNISISVGIAYVVMQCVGAIVGYGILSTLSPVDVVSGAVCVTSPHLGMTDLQSVGVETVLTAALVFISCGLWDPRNASNQDSMPIKFGLLIIGLALVGGPLTDASTNPARSLAPALWTGNWTHLWIYWVGPFLGSIVAVVLYKSVFLKKVAFD